MNPDSRHDLKEQLTARLLRDSEPFPLPPDRFPVRDVLEAAYEALPVGEADDILCLAYRLCGEQLIFVAYPQKQVDAFVREHLIPFINGSNIMKLYRTCPEYIPWIARHFRPEDLIAWSRAAGLDSRERKAFLTGCRVLDPDIMTPCDLGEHDYEFVEMRTEPAPETEDMGISIGVEFLRCRRCGYPARRSGGRIFGEGKP